MRPRHPPENTKVPSLTGFAAKRAGLKSRLASGNRRNLSQPLRLGRKKIHPHRLKNRAGKKQRGR